VGFIRASRFNHWTWVSCWASHQISWHVFYLCEINTPAFSPFPGLGNSDGTDSTVFSSLWKTVAFTEANKRQQFCLTGNHLGSQSFSSEMASKRERGICMMWTKTGFVSTRPLWSIIGLHPANVRCDAPIWPQILPSPILFKGATTTSMRPLRVTGKGTSPVRS